MKTLVMTMVVAMTGMVNAVANAKDGNFAYNTTEQNGQVTSQTVYKVEGEKYLKHHLKYEFAYDAEGRVIRKETLKWNEAANDWNLLVEHAVADSNDVQLLADN